MNRIIQNDTSTYYSVKPSDIQKIISSNPTLDDIKYFLKVYLSDKCIYVIINHLKERLETIKSLYKSGYFFSK